MQMSRKSAEMLIQGGQVTVAGAIVADPSYKISIQDARSGIKVAGRLLRLPEASKKSKASQHVNVNVNHHVLSSDSERAAGAGGEQQQQHQTEQKETVVQAMRTRVWLAHKLSGELVAEHDPQGRPSLIERLERGGVGKSKKGKSGQPVHLKPIGRLDMITEGLILVTNDGQYKREMELPSNCLHRTYR